MAKVTIDGTVARTFYNGKGAEVVEELDWQRDGGMSAALAARALKRSLTSLAKTCERQGRRDLAAWLSAEDARERRTA